MSGQAVASDCAYRTAGSTLEFTINEATQTVEFVDIDASYGCGIALELSTDTDWTIDCPDGVKGLIFVSAKLGGITNVPVFDGKSWFWTCDDNAATDIGYGN